MTEYKCKACGIKTTLTRTLAYDGEGIPKADECPNCGEDDPHVFVYL